MTTLTDLKNYLDGLMLFDKNLDLRRIDPIMSNGLMVKGKEEINKIGFAVSASLALFEVAKQDLYDAIIVHHSFNYPPYNYFDQLFHNRMSFLVKNEISLFGYHFLLDAHPEIGNALEILKFIESLPKEPFDFHDAPWGYIGEYEKEKKFQEIKDKLVPAFSTRSKYYDFGPPVVKRVAVCSGKGAPYASGMQELTDKKIDLYVTGEIHEWNRELFREAKINFIAGGHYATEVFGIKALMDKVVTQYPDTDAGWIDLVNDI